MKLPTLPTSTYTGLSDLQSGTIPLYTQYQLQQYARQAAEAMREACARRIENGSFLHDEAPDARFARECAKAIRVLGLEE